METPHHAERLWFSGQLPKVFRPVIQLHLFIHPINARLCLLQCSRRAKQTKAVSCNCLFFTSFVSQKSHITHKIPQRRRHQLSIFFHRMLTLEWPSRKPSTDNAVSRASSLIILTELQQQLISCYPQFGFPYN